MTKMKKYKAVVIETMTRTCVYYVEANNKQEAYKKLCSGETFDEIYVRVEGVVNREVDYSSFKKIE